MKLVVNIAVGTLILCVSFYGTLKGIDYFEAAPGLVYEVKFNTAAVKFYPGTKVDVTNRGVRIVSMFDKQSATAATDGALYFNIPGGIGVSTSEKKLRIEYQVSTEARDAGHRIMAQFVQNGLKSSGWHEFSTSPGQRRYALSYLAPRDARNGSKDDTIWFKGDADGRGSPVLLQSVSIYVE